MSLAYVMIGKKQWYKNKVRKSVENHSKKNLKSNEQKTWSQSHDA